MDAKEINKKWGTTMLDTLTVQGAAVVLCLGLKKNGQLAVSQTSDIHNHLNKEAIVTAINILQEQLLKME